jgi:hypothetical protein
MLDRTVKQMTGGHRGESVGDCDLCWGIAYEPGWYAVLSASEGIITLPATDGGEVIVRLPEAGPRRITGRSHHRSVADWRAVHGKPSSRGQ